MIEANIKTKWDSALNIVINKPHAVDKRLAGQQNIVTFQHRLSLDIDLNIFDSLDTEILAHGDAEDIKNRIVKILDHPESENNSVEATIIVQKLISKKGDNHCYQIVIRHGTEAQFHPLSSRDNGPYKLTLLCDIKNQTGDSVSFDDQHIVKIETSDKCGAAQSQWIKHRWVLSSDWAIELDTVL